MARGETREEALFHAQDCLAAAMEGMSGGWKTRFSVPACARTAAWPKKS